MKSFIHPESRKNEIFFTNATLSAYKNMSWNSKRKGEKSYDGNGVPLNTPNWLPVFLSKEELENKSIREIRSEWRKMIEK